MSGYCAKCGTFGRLDRYTATCAACIAAWRTAHTPHPVTVRQVGGIAVKTSETTLHTYGRHSSLEEYRDVLAKLRAFKTGGALYGIAAEGGQDAWALGQLPAQWREALESDTSVSYVVYSYTTPIAWYSEIQCGWVIPDVRYSATTTVHQNLIRAAVS